jgi:hypothetical protein
LTIRAERRLEFVESEVSRMRGSSRSAIFFIQLAYLLALGVFVILYRAAG